MKTEYEFYGKHVISEGYNLNKRDLNDINLFLSLIDEGIKKAQVTNCGITVKNFSPFGITILVLLAESHIAIHTYPEEKSLFLDIFTCGRKNPEIILDEIKNYFIKKNERGVNFDTTILERGKKNSKIIPY